MIKNLIAIVLISFISCTPSYAINNNEFLVPAFVETELSKFKQLTELPDFKGEKRYLFEIEVVWNYLVEEEVFENFRAQMNAAHENFLRCGKTYGVIVLYGPEIIQTIPGEFTYRIIFGFIELGQEV